MERFASLVVAGGLGLVAGLWVLGLAAARSPAWFAGGVLALAGAGGLVGGVGRALSWRPWG